MPAESPPPVPVLVVTGPVGVGKSTVADGVSRLLRARGVVHALVDMDALTWCVPAPPHDPFHLALGLANLAAVWQHYQQAGATRLILVDVVETRATLARYRAAVPGAGLYVVRLQAPVPTLVARLRGREPDATLAWHAARAAELTALMDAARVEDRLVPTADRSVAAVAADVLAGWEAVLPP